MEGEGVSEFNPSSHSLLDLLRIDLIQDRILMYLNFQDLKFLSEASRDTLDVVRNSKEYKKVTRLVIGAKAVENDWESVESAVDSWTGKDLKIDVTIPSLFLCCKSLETLLMDVESVKFYNSDKLRDDLDSDFLMKALEKTESIKHLEIDPIILGRSGRAVLSNGDFASNLKNVETLQINRGKGSDFCTAMEASLNMLGSLLFGLKKFVCPLPLSVSMFSYYFEVSMEIIEKNRETLEDLEIGGIDGLRRSFARLESLCIPNLKRLKILTFGRQQGTTFAEFLARQSQLDLIHINFSGMVSDEILRAVEEKHSKLKELSICIKGHLAFFHDDPGTFWNFLQIFQDLTCLMIRTNKVPGLADLYFRLSPERVSYGEDILDFVPSTVKTLVIEGFDCWRPTTSLADKNIWGRLSHLENLERLSLQGFSDSLNDEGLQALIYNCPNLTALSFSHCSQLTSYGVTGVDSSGQRTGVSLDHLKRLRYLSIGKCPEIHWKDLFPVVKFDFLTTFYFDGILDGTRSSKSQETNKEIIARLLSQNPCLENLGLHLQKSDRNAYYNVRYMSRRLTHVNLSWKMRSLENLDSDAFPLRQWSR